MEFFRNLARLFKPPFSKHRPMAPLRRIAHILITEEDNRLINAEAIKNILYSVSSDSIKSFSVLLFIQISIIDLKQTERHKLLDLSRNYISQRPLRSTETDANCGIVSRLQLWIRKSTDVEHCFCTASLLFFRADITINA